MSEKQPARGFAFEWSERHGQTSSRLQTSKALGLFYYPVCARLRPTNPARDQAGVGPCSASISSAGFFALHLRGRPSSGSRCRTPSYARGRARTAPTSYPPSADYPLWSRSQRRRQYPFARESLERAQPLVAGQPVEFTIRAVSDFPVFRPGTEENPARYFQQQLFPRVDVNPNTGEPLAQQRARRRVALNTVFHDPAHPSRIILAVIPK